MYLYLVRHGESAGNRDRLFFGQTDYPLTELGREQAAQAAEKLKTVTFDRCCASDLSRAWETAQICLNGRSIAAEKCPALREEFLGGLENKTWDEAVAILGPALDGFLNDWYHAALPGIEGAAHMECRVAEYVDAVIAAGRDTLIVAHNGSLQLLLHHLGLMGTQEMQTKWFAFGCYSVVKIEGGKAALEAFNR